MCSSDLEGQLDLLREMDCDEAQGYLFSPPVPSADYIQVVRELSERLAKKTPLR